MGTQQLQSGVGAATSPHQQVGGTLMLQSGVGAATSPHQQVGGTQLLQSGVGAATSPHLQVEVSQMLQSGVGALSHNPQAHTWLNQLLQGILRPSTTSSIGGTHSLQQRVEPSSSNSTFQPPEGAKFVLSTQELGTSSHKHPTKKKVGGATESGTKRKRIEGEPKVPANIYMRFCNEQRALNSELYKGKEGALRLGEMWKVLDPQKTIEYKRQYDADLVAYKEAMQAFKLRSSSN